MQVFWYHLLYEKKRFSYYAIEIIQNRNISAARVDTFDILPSTKEDANRGELAVSFNHQHCSILT